MTLMGHRSIEIYEKRQSADFRMNAVFQAARRGRECAQAHEFHAGRQDIIETVARRSHGRLHLHITPPCCMGRETTLSTPALYLSLNWPRMILSGSYQTEKGAEENVLIPLSAVWEHKTSRLVSRRAPFFKVFEAFRELEMLKGLLASEMQAR